MMRNLTLLLLISVVCAVAFSESLRKRRSYSNDDAAVLEVLLKNIEDGKVDLNELLDDDTNNPNRRNWFRRIRRPWGKK